MVDRGLLTQSDPNPNPDELMRSLFQSLVLLAGLGFSSTAAADTWAVDASHSQVGFSVTHMLISTVKGSFSGFEGSVETDADGKLQSLQGKVTVGSVDTSNEKRDGHLKSPDFFDIASHPEMTFRSTKITSSGQGYQMTGDLTIRGVTRPVTFAVGKLKGPVADPWGNVKAGTVATATINRQDFGVSWSQTLDTGGAVVSDEVAIELQLELVKSVGK